MDGMTVALIALGVTILAQTATAAYQWGKIAAEVRNNSLGLIRLAEELRELREEVQQYAKNQARNSASLSARLDAMERSGAGGE